ncbi:Twin-arginine translocation pathway signal sequence domain-containing protein, partial [Pandoraea apista]
MRRRDFLTFAGGLGAAWLAPVPVFAAARDLSGIAPGTVGNYGNLLILIELKGGNDGLNTVIPYADPMYASLRPSIGVKRELVVQLDERSGLHPEMRALLPMWQAKELAIVQGVGYPQPNLSHFRSIEIWNTASRSDEYLRDGWLSRAFAEQAAPPGFDADGVIVGSAELG